MRRKIIVGNWKMNPVGKDEAKRIFSSTKKTAAKLSKTHVIACPPFVYISLFTSLGKLGTSPVVGVGAQDVFFEEQGAFTGEVSSAMLKSLGVSHVIVGHSERRKMGETDEVISKKVLAVLEAGMHPILCIGEEEHDAHGLYMEILKNQIKASLAGVPRKFAPHLIIAYEPIWAIGAKEAMDPASINETSIFIKKVLADMYGRDSAITTPILYGGSTNFRNAGDIIVKGGVDGLLVGRESLNIPGFTELLKVVDSL